MVDSIVTLENEKKYLIIDQVMLNNITYYYGTRLNDNLELTNNYLFFEEEKDGKDIYLLPMYDNDMKNLLLTAFTANFVAMAYDSEV